MSHGFLQSPHFRLSDRFTHRVLLWLFKIKQGFLGDEKVI